MDIARGSLAELIDDPLIGLVMKGDRVDRRELELLLERVACKRSRARTLFGQGSDDNDGAMLIPLTVLMTPALKRRIRFPPSASCRGTDMSAR
jgi:hypothetical protein